LVYADDVNLLDDNIGIIKKNTETSTDNTKEAGLEVNRKNYVYVAVLSPECRAES
jgi:hypothetical protein